MSDNWYPECIHCDNFEYRDKLICCSANKVALAKHKLLLAIPIINRFIYDWKFCEGFVWDDDGIERR
jgi:hypothetical protein